MKELKNGHQLKICTYNVRSLSTRERLLELNNAIENIDWDIIGLAEVRKMGHNIEEHENFILCYIGETAGLHGVGFMIKKAFKNNIVNFTGISERVAILKLKFGNMPLTIIQTYAPTENSSEEEIVKFYNDLKTAHELSDKKFLVVGDFNAKIGYPKPEENMIMGKYGYGNRNGRGERLIQYASEYKLSIMNTFFKKKPSRKWTWMSPNQKIRNEIDYVLTNIPKSVMNVDILNVVNFPSDHRLLRCSLMTETPKISRKSFKPSTSLLKTTNERETYIQNLKKFSKTLDDILETTKDVQTVYNKLEEVIVKSLKQENQTKTYKHKILTNKTLNLIARRGKLLLLKNKTKEEKEELKLLFKETKKAIREDYNMHREIIIEKNLTTFRSVKRAHKELSTHKTWIQNLKEGQNETRNRKDILKHATDFYRELYKKPSEDSVPLNENKEHQGLSQVTVDPINEAEVLSHIRALKTEKSPGADNLTNETLKIGACILIPYLTTLFNMVLESERVPEQWRQSHIVLLYKKGNPQDVGNYRPISLLSAIYKLFSSILLSRIGWEIDNNQPVEQAGFRPNYSTNDHIHTIEQLIEKYKEFNRSLYIAFVDYSKAFDSISHTSIWKALENNNIHSKYINIIKNVYTKSVSRIKLERNGEEFPIEKGVKQGDPLSPKLFIAVLQDIFQGIKWTNKGLWILNSRLTHLRFADDIALFSETPTELEKMLQNLTDESQKVGLKMNTDKTKIMTNSIQSPINIDGKTIEYVNEYIYLGKLIQFDINRNENEVDRRINTTWKRYWAQKEVLKGNYSLRLKKIIMDSCILPCLTYASQTWTFTNKVKNKILSCQHAMERSILKLKRIDKIRNTDIRRKTKLTDALQHALKLKWKWAGHLARYQDNRWTLQTTEWIGPAGKRQRGRQKKRWVDEIVKTAGNNWMSTAQNKQKWKEMEEAFTQ
ncbi:hypothetical protein MSG28_007275 [Choristoneura fumiferana]|uniref:Uncharacterized protein n=1 Tax=Choristoneura fumiferana TaxID=7141 RepID=A0ACC0JWB5_CHOFU|nr:hypothetical protein MSG28_007275 [Choristoneura fumiferana]